MRDLLACCVSLRPHDLRPLVGFLALALGDLRRVVARYVHLCGRLSPEHLTASALAELFRPDPDGSTALGWLPCLDALVPLCALPSDVVRLVDE